MHARWSKANPAWGSALRVQRNAYAFAVTMVLTGGRMVCPACDTPLDLATAEVDRVVPALDYSESNCAYLCRGCNEARGILQARGADWRHVDTYADDVKRASASVTVPTVREARAWWSTRPGSGEGPVSRYA